jgi:ribonuclease J
MKNHETLTFFGGTDTTGGVHILFGSGETGLMFDFGIRHHGLFEAASPHTHTPIHPRYDRAAGQYLLAKMAPPILELYNEQTLGSLRKSDLDKIWNNQTFPSFKSMNIFISHMHQDHMALLPFVNKGIPVYMNNDSYSLYKGIVASGEYDDTSTEIHPLNDLAVVDFGDFSIQAVEMDHNATGTSGIIIKSPHYTIAYTADWRTHGRHPERIDRFIEMCQKEQVDVLLTECTRVNPETVTKPLKNRKEEEVIAEYAAVLEKAEGLIYVHILQRDIERLADFIVETHNSGRQFVMNYNTAVFWHEALRNGIQTLEHHPVLEAEAAIRVLEYGKTEGKALPYSTITIENIVEQKSKYTMFVSFNQLPQMIEFERMGDCSKRSYYFHGDHPVKPDHPVLSRWLEELNISLNRCGNGGHPLPEEISDFVEKINPKVVIPIHSWYPDLLDTRGVKAYYPHRGETVVLDNLLSK